MKKEKKENSKSYVLHTAPSTLPISDAPTSVLPCLLQQLSHFFLSLFYKLPLLAKCKQSSDAASIGLRGYFFGFYFPPPKKKRKNCGNGSKTGLRSLLYIIYIAHMVDYTFHVYKFLLEQENFGLKIYSFNTFYFFSAMRFSGSPLYNLIAIVASLCYITLCTYIG